MPDPSGPARSLAELPLIAILRGVVPEEAVEIGRTLVTAGFRLVEVPLNSPRPLESIRLMAADLAGRAHVGAGTVLRAADVDAVAAAGGAFVVAPNADATVIAAARTAGLWSAPGVATPTEGFAALAAGADALKLFPAEQMGPAVVKAWRAVFPARVPLLPVGGITPASMAAYLAAGATGFGLGSALYRPGMTSADVRLAADEFVAAWRHGRPVESIAERSAPAAAPDHHA